MSSFQSSSGSNNATKKGEPYFKTTGSLAQAWIGAGIFAGILVVAHVIITAATGGFGQAVMP
ncbi:MAG: hypothetical protein ACPKQO_08090 [Nitrososphaeraceae archaeon]